LINLGLDQLTDEQWLELLNELLCDGIRRDPYLRKLGQNAIYTAGQCRREITAWYEELVTSHRERLRQAAREETAKWFEQWVADKILLTAADERECVDEGMKLGRTTVASNALLNRAIPIGKRLTSAFAFTNLLKLVMQKTPTADLIGVLNFSSGWFAQTIISMSKTLYGLPWKTVEVRRDLLECSAPQHLIEALLVEYAENGGYPDQTIIEPLIGAESTSEALLPDPPIPVENLLCVVCKSITIICPHCKGYYCQKCDWCVTCKFTMLGRKTR
jgi:hypothetical protein